MNTLYPELVSVIFDQVCEDYRESIRETMIDRDNGSTDLYNPMHFGRVKRPTTPINLTQVCRRWKEIADSTPELWDTIHLKPYWSVHKEYLLTIKISKEEPLKRYLDTSKHLEQWLHRAGVVPLTIKIHERFCMGTDFELAHMVGDGSITRQVLAHFKQWRRLEMHCPSADATNFTKLQEVLCEPLPLLETFILHPRESPFPHTITYLNAPNITSTTRYSTINLFTPPSASLRMVNFEKALNYNDIMDYFYYCENLESYAITLIKSGESFPRAPFEVRSPRELIITTRPEDEDVDVATIFADILDSISTPFLQKLSLDADIPNGMLIEFLDQSSYPPLTTLSISTDKIWGDDILELLSVVPKLTHLQLSAAGFFPPTTESDAHPLVELSYLTSLILPRPYFTFTEESLAIYLLKNLSLPKLQELDVWLPELCTKQNYYDDSESFTSFIDFQPTLIDIPNIYSQLRTLTIHISDTKHLKCFITIVKDLLNLECIHVLFSGEVRVQNYNDRDNDLSLFGATFMKMLLPSVSDLEDKPLDTTSERLRIIHLPKLKDLSYEGVFTTATSQEALISALEFRWKGVEDNKMEILKSARIFSSESHKPFREATEDIARRIEQLRLQGMDLSLFA